LQEVVVEAQKEEPEETELKDRSACVTVIKSEEFKASLSKQFSLRRLQA